MSKTIVIRKKVNKPKQEMTVKESKELIRAQIREKGWEKTFKEALPIFEEGPHMETLRELDLFQEKEEWGKLSAQETFALFITLSPEPGTVAPEDILSTFSNMLGKPKKGIYKAYWSIQQSGGVGEKPEGYRPHLHCLIVLDKRAGPSAERNKIKSMLTRHLSKYKTKSEVYLDIKSVSREKVKDKLDYVLDTNYNKEKMKTAEIDKVWRQKNGFQPYYECS